MRHDSVLSGGGRSAARAQSAVRAVWRKLASLRLRSYASAAMAAVMAGIVVNATLLQHERHPAPFFRPSPVRLAAPAPAPVPAEPAPAMPPQRPAELTTGAIAPAPPRRLDAIGDLLRAGRDAKEMQKLVTAAQTDLNRLGYTLRVDGKLGADTVDALQEFEKGHGMPLTTDVTPKLVKALAAAAK